MPGRPEVIFFLISSATIASGCAATYAPPSHTEAATSQQCPVGQMLVCRDSYDSTPGRETDAPESCMCQALRTVR